MACCQPIERASESPGLLITGSQVRALVRPPEISTTQSVRILVVGHSDRTSSVIPTRHLLLSLRLAIRQPDDQANEGPKRRKPFEPPRCAVTIFPELFANPSENADRIFLLVPSPLWEVARWNRRDACTFLHLEKQHSGAVVRRALHSSPITKQQMGVCRCSAPSSTEKISKPVP